MMENRHTKFLKYRLEGQITVFTSLILVLILVVITTAIKSAMISVTLVNINMGANLAIESVFAGYSKDLFDKYNLLFLSDPDTLQGKLEKYIRNNTYSWNGYMKYSVQDINIDEVVRATDQNGNILKNEVVEYMKLGILPEVVSRLTDQYQQLEGTNMTQEYIKKVEDCFESTNHIDRISLQLLSLIEGIDTDENGFVVVNGSPVRTNQGFVKQLSIDTVTPQNMYIENQTIYQTVSDDCINIIEKISDLRNKILRSDDKQRITQISAYYDFNREFHDVMSLIEQTNDRIKEASDIASEYSGVSQQLNDKINYIEQSMGEKINKFYPEGGLNEIYDLIDYGKDENNSICNINKIIEALKENALVIEKSASALKNIKILLENDSSTDAVLTELDKFEALIKKFDISKFLFRYSGLRLKDSASGIGMITGIGDMMRDKFLSIVLENRSFSNKVIKIGNLASDEKYIRGSENGERDLESDILYNEYVISKFPSYTDENEWEKSQQREIPLSYELEYILNGNKEDKKNLEETLAKIWILRQGFNLGSLFKDSKLRNQSYEMATALLGFTGNYAMIKAGQFLIMNIWAMGESIVDLKILCRNEKVPLFKNSETWNLGINELINCNFNVDNANKTEGQALSYKDYIRVLLNLYSSNKKYYLTMDMIELNMIHTGMKDFRFKNQVFSLNATAQFKINQNQSFYSKKFSYQY